MSVPSEYLKIEHKIHELLSEALTFDDQDMPLEAYKKYCESMQALMKVIRHSAERPNLDEPRRKLSLQSVKMAQQCISRMSEIVENLETNEPNMEDLNKSLDEALSTLLTDSPSDEDDNGVSVAEFSNEYTRQSSPSATTSTPPPSTIPMVTSKPATFSSLAPPSPGKVSMNLRQARKAFEKKQIQVFQAAKRPVDDKLVQHLIEKRQTNLSNLVNDKVSGIVQLFTGKVADIRESYTERLEEDHWEKSLQRALASEDTYIIEPILQIFGKRGNPIAELVQDFLLRQRKQLEQLSGEDPAEVQTAIDELHLFTYHLVDLMTHNYPELNGKDHLLNLKLTIQHYIFTTPLGELYLSALRRKNRSVSQNFHQKCSALSWSDVYERMGVREKFRDPIHAGQYVMRDGEGSETYAIDEIRRVPMQLTPFLKLSAISQACNLLSADHTTEASQIGSEDLLLLLASSIVRAIPSDVYAEFEFISELVPEEVLKGESGYVLASFQTALLYIEQVQLQ